MMAATVLESITRNAWYSRMSPVMLDDYLKKQAEAQFAVRESELVDAVKKVLARNNVTWG